jgi:hypothetical protein
MQPDCSFRARMFPDCSCYGQWFVLVFEIYPHFDRPGEGGQCFGGSMVSWVRTVAFQGIKAVPVDVQVMIAPGKTGMQIVGLPDKAVAESRERVQAALHASGLSMPAKKVTVNLAPADLPKEGSHYDLPIALWLMAGLGAIPGDALSDYVVLGRSRRSPAHCRPPSAPTRLARA